MSKTDSTAAPRTSIEDAPDELFTAESLIQGAVALVENCQTGGPGKPELETVRRILEAARAMVHETAVAVMDADSYAKGVCHA